MTNAQSKHMETKTIVIDLSKYINSENIIKDMARDMAKEIATDIKSNDIEKDIAKNIAKGVAKKITTEDINNWKGWSEEDKELLKKLNEDDGDECARDIML